MANYSQPHIAIAVAGLMALSPGQADQARGLVQQAQELGARVLANDGRARDEARRRLDEAERIVRAELKRDAGCEACVEVQAAVHLFRSTYKLANEYDDCITTARKGLERFPQNPRLAYFMGYAHYNSGDVRNGIAAFQRFVSLSPDDPLTPQVKQWIADGQNQFLTGWYKQAAFYQVAESRITAYNAQTFRNDVVFQVTPEYELQMGAQGFTALAQNAPRANDPEAVAFLQQLVNRIVEKTPGPGFRYTVTLIESNDVNAVTPPGHIVVYTGLLRTVDTEAQLAGVLSHEVAHNYGHHAARRLLKAYHAQNIAATLTRAINPQGATSQAVTTLATSIGMGLFLNAYSRFEEQEADLYGTHLMFNAGYNPTALPSMFLKLYEANPRQPIKFLSTHPPAPDRVNYLTDYLEAFPLDRDLVVDSSDAFKKLKERYKPGSAPVAGAVTTTAAAGGSCQGSDYGMTITPTVARAGDKVNVQATGPGGKFPERAWLALFPAGGSSHLGQWSYFDQMRACGFKEFTAPGPGDYEVRLLLDSGYDKIAARGTFKVQ